VGPDRIEKYKYTTQIHLPPTCAKIKTVITRITFTLVYPLNNIVVNGVVYYSGFIGYNGVHGTVKYLSPIPSHSFS
jgi:hypothetical protein